MLWLLGALLPLRAAQPLTAPPQLPQARVVVVQDKRAMEAFTKRSLADGMKYLGCAAHFIGDSSAPGHVPFGATRVNPLAARD